MREARCSGRRVTAPEPGHRHPQPVMSNDIETAIARGFCCPKGCKVFIKMATTDKWRRRAVKPVCEAHAPAEVAAAIKNLGDKGFAIAAKERAGAWR